MPLTLEQKSEILIAINYSDYAAAKHLIGEDSLEVWFYAVEIGNTKLLEFVLQSDKDIINSFDPNGLAAIHHAAKKGNIDVIQFLFDHGADPNSKSSSQAASPIHYASSNLGAIKLLCAKGAEMSSQDSAGWTALYWVLKDGGPELLNFLISKIDINSRDLDEQTALHWAVRFNDETAIELLVNTGNHDLLNSQDKWGDTALHYAVRNKNAKVIKCLMDQNVDTSLTNNNGETIFDLVSDIEFVEILGSISAHSDQHDLGAPISSSDDDISAAGACSQDHADIA